MTVVTNSLRNEADLPQAKVPVNIVLLSSTGSLLTSAFIDTIEIDPNVSTVTDVDGTWTLHLYANDEITPTGTQYEVTHVLSTGNQTSLFVVPSDGATPVTHHLSELVV